MPTTPFTALEFLRSAELPPAPALDTITLEAVGDFDYDKDKEQALVVGSDIISFVKGLTDERRRDIVNATLLAKLVAKKKVPDPTDIFRWYDAYFDVLRHI